MAPSNRDRVGKGLELLAEGLRPFVEQQVGSTAGSDDWFTTYNAHTGRAGQQQSLDDPHVLLNVIEHFWQPVFGRTLDCIEVLLRGASASEQEAQARDLKDEVMRARYAEQERRGAEQHLDAVE